MTKHLTNYFIHLFAHRTKLSSFSSSMNSNHPSPGTGSGAGFRTGGGSDIDSMERNMERNLEDNLSITERRTAPIRIVTGGLEKALEKVSYSYRYSTVRCSTVCYSRNIITIIIIEMCSTVFIVEFSALFTLCHFSTIVLI